MGHAHSVDDCGKNSYPSRSFALDVIRKRMRDNHTVVLREYLCKRCGHWHITSQVDRFKPISTED